MLIKLCWISSAVLIASSPAESRAGHHRYHLRAQVDGVAIAAALRSWDSRFRDGGRGGIELGFCLLNSL